MRIILGVSKITAFSFWCFFLLPAQAVISEKMIGNQQVEYAGVESNADQLIDDQDWWKSWKEMTESGLITELHNCNSIAGLAELNAKQQLLINNECKDMIFVDTFNNEEGNALAPFSGVAEIDGIAQLQKWNVSKGNGVIVRRGSNPYVGDFNNPLSYSVQLGAQGNSSRIETKGWLAVEKGEYTLTFRVKERIGAGSEAKYSGVKTKITGNESTYAEKNHFIQTSPHNRLWSTVTIDFNVMVKRDDIKISIENIFNGQSDEAAIIDTIVLFKKR